MPLFPRRPASRSSDRAPELCEALEPRKLLSLSGLPTLADLENPDNPVVRFETTFGDIDVELFAQDAPIHVANFLNYINGGDYGQSFFHRLVPDFVLQGGGFRFSDETSTVSVPTDDPVQDEVMRSNVERTIAMAKAGPNTTTSQWFFNLTDNTELDDTGRPDGGFGAFGRVVTEASWSVVQTIAALDTESFNAPFGDLPVRQDVPDFESPTEEDLVFVVDAEIIKPQGSSEFYDERVFYPEGFAGATINEFLPIFNPNDTEVYYQVIARTELDSSQIDGFADQTFFRDRVLADGTIPANTRSGITISTFSDTSNDLVPQGISYALEVRSTAPVSANLSHYDFGTATGEAFVRELDDSFFFGEGRRQAGEQSDFLLWHNPTGFPLDVEITFYFEDKAPATVSTTTDPYRRGGLALGQMPQIEEGDVFSTRITGSAPFIAALTRFDSVNQNGATAAGQPGDGLAFGVIPGATLADGEAEQFITVVNPGPGAALVTMVLSTDDGDDIVVSPTVSGLIIPVGQRRSYDFADFADTLGDRVFSIRYSTNSAPVAAQMSNITTFESGARDSVSHPALTGGATDILFPEGFIDPGRAGTDIFEALAFYNPNEEFFIGEDITATVNVSLYYTDGFELDLGNIEVGAADMVVVNLEETEAVLNQGLNNNRFFYSVRVRSDVPISASFWHYDLSLGGLQPAGGFATIGTFLSEFIPLDKLDPTITD